MQYLFEHQDDEFALDRAFADFKSYLKAYIELADKDFDHYEDYPNLVHFVDGFDLSPELTPVVEFELLKSVLNPSGILQIGKELFKFTDKFVYVTMDMQAVDLFVSNQYSRIRCLKKNPIMSKPLEVSNRGAFYGVCENYYTNNTKRKVRGQANALSSLEPGYQEIFLKTQALKKHWWGWAAYRHDELVIRGTGIYTQLGNDPRYPLFEYDVDKTKHHTYGVKKVLDWGINLPAPFIFVNNNTWHDARWDKGCTVIIN